MRECGNLVRQWCELRRAGEVAHYAGLRSCGSPWACPVCSVKIAAGRVEEIAHAVQGAIDDGWGVCFLTATFSHHRGQDLAWLLDCQQRAWRLVVKSRAWRALRLRYGVVLAPRVREVTWGEANGWHPHLHGAVMTRGWLSDSERVALGDQLGAEWRAALVAVGLSGSVEHAFRLDGWDKSQAKDLAGYLSKQLAIEVAGGAFKSGREGRFSPFGLLDLATGGEVFAVRLWHEYEGATAGKRTIFWPTNWAYRPVQEVSDEELAEAEVGGEVVALFDLAVKRAIWAASPRGVELLELCEKGRDLAVSYLAFHAPAGGRWLLGGDPDGS